MLAAADPGGARYGAVVSMRADVAYWNPMTIHDVTRVLDATAANTQLVLTPAFHRWSHGAKQVRDSLGGAESSLNDTKSSLGGAESSLGDAKSSLRDAKSSLGDAESSLGDAKSSLGDV
jgi:nitrogen fixation-related uncharacterized protein